MNQLIDQLNSQLKIKIETFSALIDGLSNFLISKGKNLLISALQMYKFSLLSLDLRHCIDFSEILIIIFIGILHQKLTDSLGKYSVD